MKKGNAGPDSLFEPVKLGRFSLPNRLVMAPLTLATARERADGT